MEGLLIRDYRSGDYRSIIELWNLTDLGGAQRGDNQQIIEHSITLGGKLLVVDYKSKIIGTSWMTFDGRRLHLHHFGIHPDFQRKGIGMMLVKDSLRYVKLKGYHVKLEVHKTNTAAIELYKKVGFRFLGDYDVYIIRDLDSIGT